MYYLFHLKVRFCAKDCVWPPHTRNRFGGGGECALAVYVCMYVCTRPQRPGAATWRCHARVTPARSPWRLHIACVPRLRQRQSFFMLSCLWRSAESYDISPVQPSLRCVHSSISSYLCTSPFYSFAMPGHFAAERGRSFARAD